jgi:hypothetical protein
MKKPVLLISFLLVGVFVLSIVRIFVSNNIATSGVALGNIEEEAQRYKLENSILSERLYIYSSLTNIASKAYDLGYTDKKSNYVIGQQLPVALKQ